MNPSWTGLAKFSSVFLRLALGASFLSAVADRFGLWGAYGQPNVAWGNYARFVDYTAKLNWFLPASVIPVLAIIATAAETLFGILLLVGWKTRIAARLSGFLLVIFALAITMALEIKALSICQSFRLRRERYSWEHVRVFRIAWMNRFGGTDKESCSGSQEAVAGRHTNLPLPSTDH